MPVSPPLPPSECETDEMQKEAEDRCNLLLTTYPDCTRAVGDEQVNKIVENCIFDACLMKDIPPAFCGAALGFMTTCNEMMDHPINWREEFGCRKWF